MNTEQEKSGKTVEFVVGDKDYCMKFAYEVNGETSLKVIVEDKTETIKRGRVVVLGKYYNNLNTFGHHIGERFMHVLMTSCKTEVDLIDFLESKFTN